MMNPGVPRSKVPGNLRQVPKASKSWLDRQILSGCFGHEMICTSLVMSVGRRICFQDVVLIIAAY